MPEAQRSHHCLTSLAVKILSPCYEAAISFPESYNCWLLSFPWASSRRVWRCLLCDHPNGREQLRLQCSPNKPNSLSLSWSVTCASPLTSPGLPPVCCLFPQLMFSELHTVALCPPPVTKRARMSSLDVPAKLGLGTVHINTHTCIATHRSSFLKQEIHRKKEIKGDAWLARGEEIKFMTALLTIDAYPTLRMSYICKKSIWPFFIQ